MSLTAAQIKYSKSSKGLVARSKYLSSIKGRETKKRYLARRKAKLAEKKQIEVIAPVKIEEEASKIETESTSKK